MDKKDGPLIGLLGPEHEFEQPLTRSEFFGMVPEFPGGRCLQTSKPIRDHFERNIGGAADLQEGIAGYRIERLNSAIHEHGQSAKFAHMELAVLFGENNCDNFRKK